MGNKTTGRNWTRRSIEEIFDDMFAKKGGSPGPSGQGDVFALMATGNLAGDVAVVRNYFKGYQSLSLGDGTVNNRNTYKHSGVGDIDVIMWFDVYGATGIQSLHWKANSFGNGSMLLCLPPSGNDLYLVSYYGEEVFTTQSYNFTLTGSGQQSNMTYQCTRFAPQFATNLDGELSNCPAYGSGSFVLLIKTNSNVGLDDNSLLSIANTIMRYYQSGQTFNNIIRV